jgi:hypothetical protein
MATQQLQSSVATSKSGSAASKVQPTPKAPKSAGPVPQFISPPPGRDFYFGYGANMAPRVVKRRNISPDSALPAMLPNHKLYFNHIGGAASSMAP